MNHIIQENKKVKTFGIYCTNDLEYCEQLMDKFCSAYGQHLVFNKETNNYERCSRCLLKLRNFDEEK